MSKEYHQSSSISVPITHRAARINTAASHSLPRATLARPAGPSCATGHFLPQKVARDYCSLSLRFERQSRSLSPNWPVFRWVPDTGVLHSLSAISAGRRVARPRGTPRGMRKRRLFFAFEDVKASLAIAAGKSRTWRLRTSFSLTWPTHVP